MCMNTIFSMSAFTFWITNLFVLTSRNQGTESLSSNNKEELKDNDNLDTKKENIETEENENRLNDNRTEENNIQTNKVKTDNSKTEPKKEERQTVKKDEQVNSNTEQPIEDKNIKSINFTNSYITKEIYGTLSYNGGSNITISSMQYSTITIDEIKKLNPIVISPSNSEYENITYTTSNKNIAEFVGDELRIYTYGETDIIATFSILGEYIYSSKDFETLKFVYGLFEKRFLQYKEGTDDTLDDIYKCLNVAMYGHAALIDNYHISSSKDIDQNLINQIHKSLFEK